MPRYSVMIAAWAAFSLAVTSSTTATFWARGFSVVMYTSSRFDSGARFAANTARSKRHGCRMIRSRVHLGWWANPLSREGPAVFGERLLWLCGKTTGAFAGASRPMVGVPHLGAQPAGI